MRSKKIGLPWKIAAITISLLLVISVGYYYQLKAGKNTASNKTIRMGYMPVITNLASPLLDYASKDRKDVQFKAMKFSSFAEMGESLRNGKIDVAFIIAPLSIALKQQGEDIKVVYIGNRHESTLVFRKGLKVKTLSDLAGHTIAVPIRFSGHNITLRKLLKKEGLEDKIKVVEMNPPDMPVGLASGALDAYFVGEPFPSKTLTAGSSERLYYVEEIAPHFICNLMIVRNEFIQKDPAIVKMLVQGAVRSGMWAKNHLDKAAQIASEYWGTPLPIVNYALNTPPNRVLFDLYQPKQEEMQAMADDMLSLGLIKNNNIVGLVDDQFAKTADLNNIGDDIHSIFPK
jgi:NitT/TauT family transport system substrate-binding protein